MSKSQFLKFIKEARELLPHANLQQKKKLFSLIKENWKKVQKEKIVVSESSDYLSEK